MKIKKGFTLAEVLIALGIIAVMASLMATTFSQARPNKTKMLYLKAYDSLVIAVKQMGNDPTLFNPYTGIGQNIYNIESYPFLDPVLSLNPTFRNCNEPRLKFACILGEVLSEYDRTTSGTSSYSFSTPPGNFRWTVTPIGDPLSNNGATEAKYANQVTLNIDNSNTNYNFCVQADGEIDVMDDAGVTFIFNRKNVRSKHDVSKTASVTACEPKILHINGAGTNYFNVAE